MDTVAPILRIENLEVRYRKVVGLRRLDLDVAPGEIVVLLGSNGAGKSSALNAIAGAIPSQGTVELRGKDVNGLPAWRIARQGMVLVPEGRRIIGPLSVEENLRLGGSARRNGGADAALGEVYEMFPVLGERRTELGGLLSGGQQQMLAFGRALMADPAVVLLDEPSMGLAPVMVDRVLDVVTSIAARGIAVLMVEQNASALDVATRAAVLERGELVVEGDPSALRDDPRVTRAFLGIG